VAALLDRVIEACEKEPASAGEIYERSLPPVTAVSELTRNPMFEQSFHTAWFALQRSLRGARTLLNPPAFIAARFRELRTAVLTCDIDLAENAAWRLLRDEREGGL
jgi:DNA-binding FadR family transcriptional regulator